MSAKVHFGELGKLANEQAEYRKKLAKIESENVQLRAENVQLKSEKQQLKSEQIRLEAEMKELKSGNSAVRKELLDTLNHYSNLMSHQQQLNLGMVGIQESMNPMYVGERESETLKTLEIVLKSGLDLVKTGVAMREIYLKHLPEMKLEPVENAKSLVLLDDWKAAAEKFVRLSVPPGKPSGFESCRILEVNDALNVAVISAGYRNGVRIGMMLKSADEDLLLKVVAVRPFVAAVMPEKGSIRKISLGMEARAAGAKN